MGKPALNIRLLSAAMVILLIGCKHNQKQVTAVERKPVKKPAVASNKPAPARQPEAHHASSELEQKLGISSKQVRDSKLYSFIAEWYGTPYKYSGCQKTGIDCSCFTSLLYEEVYGKKIARTSNDMFKTCDQIEIDEAHVGDLVFFKIGGSTISHVGVYLKNRLFVHASNSRGVIINSLDEAYYKKYFFCAGKMKSV